MSDIESRNSQTADEWEQSQFDAREAAQSARLAEPGWPDVGQGARDNDPAGLDVARLVDHQYFLDHKAEILAQLAAGELPGQSHHIADPA